MPKIHQTAGSNGSRRGRGARVTTTLSEINVVPLVDVMLVLLIIFMVTAPMMQQGLQVNLPQARRASAVTAQPVTVTVPIDFGKKRTVQLDKEDVPIAFLGERVRQALLVRDDKSVFIRADGAVTVPEMVAVWDQLKEGGVEKVGMMTKPIER
jgi:biopolymer transport protein TolR